MSLQAYLTLGIKIVRILLQIIYVHPTSCCYFQLMCNPLKHCVTNTVSHKKKKKKKKNNLKTPQQFIDLLTESISIIP